MSRYSEEFKHAVVTRVMPPNNESVAKVAHEIGVGVSTLHKWKQQAKVHGIPVSPDTKRADRWSTQEKFQTVVETASLSEVELAEYCRSKGLYVEQVHAWRDACIQANGGVAQEASRLQREVREKEREIKHLQKDLRHKEAALAETAALLVLRKKADAIWGDREDA